MPAGAAARLPWIKSCPATGYHRRSLPAGSPYALFRPSPFPAMKPRDVPLFAFALFCAAMMGLAMGAVWMVMAMYLHRPAPWLALPAGAALAWAIRRWIRRPGTGAAVLAAFATALAALYFNTLMAAILLAGNFDMGLPDALRTAGAGMLLALARLGATPADFVWYALGMLLSAWLAWRRAAPRR
jgi:vitamin B12 transport system permease protein